jgi:hypothetical protein
MAKAGISSSFMRVVRALTRLSRSFFSIRSSDTREGSPKPENDQSLEIDAEEAKLDVAEKMPSVGSLTAHLRFHSSEPGYEPAAA